MNMSDLTEEQMAEVKAIKDGMRITKVVATRSVKTKNGDFFVGFSSSWDTTQEDAGGMGADLIDAVGDADMKAAVSRQGMTPRQAKIAGLILGMHTDLQATTHALGGGAISQRAHENACHGIKANYSQLIAQAVAGKGAKDGDE